MQSTLKAARLLGALKQYGFFNALFAVCLGILADFGGELATVGQWLKNHHDPDLLVVSIFLISGSVLSLNQLKDGSRDDKGTSNI